MSQLFCQGSWIWCCKCFATIITMLSCLMSEMIPAGWLSLASVGSSLLPDPFFGHDSMQYPFRLLSAFPQLNSMTRLHEPLGFHDLFLFTTSICWSQLPKCEAASWRVRLTWSHKSNPVHVTTLKAVRLSYVFVRGRLRGHGTDTFHLLVYQFLRLSIPKLPYHLPQTHRFLWQATVRSCSKRNICVSICSTTMYMWSFFATSLL